MSYRKVLACAASAWLAMPAAPLVAQDAAAWTWARAHSGNGIYSVELPCRAEEVALHSAMLVRSRADVLVRARVERAARTVACRRGGTVFTVEMVTIQDDAPLPTPAYDQLASGVRAALPVKGLEVRETMHSGRRMLTSRQVSGGTVGQTGVIEVTDRSYLLLIAGTGSEAPQAEIDAHIGRFFASVEVGN